MNKEIKKQIFSRIYWFLPILLGAAIYDAWVFWVLAIINLCLIAYWTSRIDEVKK